MRAKVNRYFAEWRFSFLPISFADLISDYQKRTESIKKYLINGIGAYPARLSAERGDAVFFFANEKGRISPLTSKNLKHKLKEEISIKHGGDSYLLKINATRHLYATTALEMDLPRVLIDALTGHTTRGREPLSPFSLLLSDEIKIAAAPVAQHIAESLGLFQI